jgi:hypothetical protein
VRQAELDAVVGEHGVDPVGHGGDEGDEEGRGGDPGGRLHQLDEGELAGAVDGDEEIELAFGGLNLSDVDVEEADRVGFFFVGLSPSTSGSRPMPWRCRQRCNDDRVRCGMVACSA